jgi:hypothetical protein
VSDTYITLLIPTSIIPSWDPGPDQDENDAKARIREGCGWLKNNAGKLVVVIDRKNWIAYGVSADPDRAAAILFIVQVADIGGFLISLINGDITKIKNGSGLLPYSLEIGGNKPPPPVPHIPDAVFNLAIAIGADSALAEIKGDKPPDPPSDPPSKATEGD